MRVTKFLVVLVLLYIWLTVAWLVRRLRHLSGLRSMSRPILFALTKGKRREQAVALFTTVHVVCSALLTPAVQNTGIKFVFELMDICRYAIRLRNDKLS